MHSIAIITRNRHQLDTSGVTPTLSAAVATRNAGKADEAHRCVVARRPAAGRGCDEESRPAVQWKPPARRPTASRRFLSWIPKRRGNAALRAFFFPGFSVKWQSDFLSLLETD